MNIIVIARKNGTGTRVQAASGWARRTFRGIGLSFMVLFGAAALPAQMATNAPAGTSLRLDEYLRRVWERNETIQMRALDAAISDERHEAEKGILEPEFISSFDAVDRRRPNTEEQKRNLSSGLFGLGPSVYNERNRSYQSAIESTLSTGTKLRAGYSLQSLYNNLNDPFPDGEWLTSVGFAVTQPLLRGFGPKVTLASIRAAAINSEISFQDYRKGLAELISKAEATYWVLYQAQEESAIANESTRLAETILKDNRKRFELGKAPELDVLQAEAGLALRQATAVEARQRLKQAQSQVAIFVSASSEKAEERFLAADVPQAGAKQLRYGTLWALAYEYNPELLSLFKQAQVDDIRLVVAKNQRLPQLDLKGGYSFTGLDHDPASSWDAAGKQDFPTWSIGLELHVPLGGGNKSKHELKAAQLRQKGTVLALESMQNQLSNGLQALLQSVLAYQDNVARFQKAVDFNQDVLKNQLARLDAGKTDSRAVLQAEEDLFKARISALDNLVRYQRAGLDLETVAGTVLRNRGLDMSHDELRQRTAALTKSGKITPEKYAQFVEGMRREFDKRRGTASGSPR